MTRGLIFNLLCSLPTQAVVKRMSTLAPTDSSGRPVTPLGGWGSVQMVMVMVVRQFFRVSLGASARASLHHAYCALLD